MKTSLNGIGKRYTRHWVFAAINHVFAEGTKTAILGHNGSGKSTLLRIIAGMQTPSAGKVQWADAGPETVFSRVSFCAPGIELPEELTLEELLRFHFTYKPLLAGFSIASIIEKTGLQRASNKPIADFSSGMKQRVKLATAFFSDTPLLLLDEPCTNLDEAGVDQYHELLGCCADNRTVIIASNDAREYPGIGLKMVMNDYQQLR